MTGNDRERRRWPAALLLCLAAAMPASAQDAPGGQFSGFELSGDQPIEIESDRLEVRENESIAIFTGNVSVVQGETLLKTARMTVHYSQTDGGSAATGGSDIERLEVEGKVYVRSKNQVATGDQGSFDMASEVLVLTGDEVVLSEGENVVVGCKLTANMKSGQSQLDGCDGSQGGGRVKMLLQPGSQNR